MGKCATICFMIGALTVAMIACQGNSSAEETSNWTASIQGGRAAGTYSGTKATATLVRGQVLSVNLQSDSPLNCPVITVRPEAEGARVVQTHGYATAAFFGCDGSWGTQEAPFEIGSGNGSQGYPEFATLEIQEISESFVTGKLHGEFFQRRDGVERNNPKVRAKVEIQFRARVR